MTSQLANRGNKPALKWPRPPRAVQTRPGAAVAIWMQRLIGTGIIGFAVFASIAIGLTPATLVYGRDQLAIIQKVETNARIGRKKYHFVVTFIADAGNGPDSYRKDYPAAFAPPSVGKQVPIRTLTFGPFHRVEFAIPDPRGTAMRMIAFFSPFIGLLIVFGASAWIEPIVHRRLLRDGDVAIATVTSKTTRRVKQSRMYRIDYDFMASDGSSRRGKNDVSRTVYDLLNAGDPVVVLYRPNAPRRNRMYDAMEYQLAPDRTRLPFDRI